MEFRKITNGLQIDFTTLINLHFVFEKREFKAKPKNTNI